MLLRSLSLVPRIGIRASSTCCGSGCVVCPADDHVYKDHEAPRMIKLLDLVPNKRIDVGNHGYVQLLAVSPHEVEEGETGDTLITKAARTSYDRGTKTINDDKALINCLMRDWHWSPFEMADALFEVSMPLFTAAQWNRHRAGKYNYVSYRYSEAEDKFYRPEVVRRQSQTNKQGGDMIIDGVTSNKYYNYLERSEAIHGEYLELLEADVAREDARIGLSQAAYTKCWFKMDIRNLLNFLRLRMDEHAQTDIREHAHAIYELIQPVFPHTCSAFENYILESVTFSKMEAESIALGKNLVINKRERRNFKKKLKQMGLLDQVQFQF